MTTDERQDTESYMIREPATLVDMRYFASASDATTLTLSKFNALEIIGYITVAQRDRDYYIAECRRLNKEITRLAASALPQESKP